MKHIEIEDHTELRDFLGLPDRDWTSVVLQALDLSEQDDTLAAEDLTKSTAFIGCTLGVALTKKAADVGCLLLSPRNGLPYNPYRHAVYSWRDLLDCYSPANPESYRFCLDWLAYETAMDETTKKKRAVLTLADELLSRLHDFTQEDALLDFLKPVRSDATTWQQCGAEAQTWLATPPATGQRAEQGRLPACDSADGFHPRHHRPHRPVGFLRSGGLILRDEMLPPQDQEDF